MTTRTPSERGEAITGVVVLMLLLTGGALGAFIGIQTGARAVKECITEEAARNPKARLGVVAPILVQTCQPEPQHGH